MANSIDSDLDDNGPQRGISGRVRVAIALLERDRADPKLRLARVAQFLRVSATHLSRVIKKETGLGFREHLIGTRIREAQLHLLNPAKSVKEVAACVGYDSTSSFDREFRRVHGCSPTKWRRQVLEL